jgi:hypothetical protein
MFNSLKYNVVAIELYSPSIHTFANGSVDAEIIISHISTQSGAPLLVCIPIMSQGVASSEGTVLLEDIVSQAVSKPLNEFDPAMSIRVQNFNLNSIVPKKSFFYYQKNIGHFIIYDLANALYMDPNKISGLRTLITPFTMTSLIQPTDELFFNSSGANAHAMTDGNIYIDCAPTGNSRETTDVPFKNATKNDMMNTLSSPLFVLLGATIVFVIILLVVYTGFKFLSGDDMEFAFLNQVRKKIVQKGRDLTKENSFINRNINRIGTGVRNMSALGVPLNQRFTNPIPDSK